MAVSLTDSKNDNLPESIRLRNIPSVTLLCYEE